MSNTPNRSVRVPDHIWKSAERLAEHRGISVSDVVRRALVAYLRERCRRGKSALQ